MKRAIIIPIFLRFRQSEELPELETFEVAGRAIKSLRMLEKQDVTPAEEGLGETLECC